MLSFRDSDGYFSLLLFLASDYRLLSDLPQTQVEDEADKLWSPTGQDDGHHPAFPLTTETIKIDDSAADNPADDTADASDDKGAKFNIDLSEL